MHLIMDLGSIVELICSVTAFFFSSGLPPSSVRYLIRKIKCLEGVGKARKANGVSLRGLESRKHHRTARACA